MNINDIYVLGISAYFHDSAAVLLKGNQILAAVQEERFTRKKSDPSFPVNAINYCLSFLPKNKEPDYVAFYEDPILKLDRIYLNALNNAPRGAPLWKQTLRTTNLLSNDLPELLKGLKGDPQKIFFSKHHDSHAASAFYPSDFDESAILVVDGVGEWSTATIFHGTDQNICGLREIRYPHSLGLLYSAFTQYCGFKVNSGEYKLMGLAPFGEPHFVSLILEKLIELKNDGSFRLNLEYFDYTTNMSTINPLFGALFGRQSRHPSEPITKHYRDVAASAQFVIERVMRSLAKTALQLTGSKNLCLAGGVALNCVANSEIAKVLSKSGQLWIQPASGDAGGALGAALNIAKKIGVEGKLHMSAFLGPEFSQSNIQEILDDYGVRYRYIENEKEYISVVVNDLINKKIVGHFNGRMEFGPRALGNRSILADPRPNDMLQNVNMKIKFRESWRPFAPVILEHDVATYFESDIKSPYMLLTSKIKAEYRKHVDLKRLRNQGQNLYSIMNEGYSDFPAITHCDYSSRLQTVNETNGLFYRLLNSFKEKSGCPMLLNTSFNVRGEPIVCSPKDALDCFFNTDLDILAINKFYIEKDIQSNQLKVKKGKMKFDAD